MDLFVSYDPHFYSLDFDFDIYIRAQKVTGTFEERVPRHANTPKQQSTIRIRRSP